jgi:hypothetical protein
MLFTGEITYLVFDIATEVKGIDNGFLTDPKA